MAECFNNVLRGARHLPITACVKFILEQTVKLFVANWNLACQLRNNYPKNIWHKYVANEARGRKHTVRSFDQRHGIYSVLTCRRENKGGNIQIVNFHERTCSCGKFTQIQFPCSHVFAACFKSNIQPATFIHPIYSNNVYRETYYCQFNPVRHEDYWDETDFFLQFCKSRLAKKRGKVRSVRIRNEMDRRCQILRDDVVIAIDQAIIYQIVHRPVIQHSYFFLVIQLLNWN